MRVLLLLLCTSVFSCYGQFNRPDYGVMVGGEYHGYRTTGWHTDVVARFPFGKNRWSHNYSLGYAESEFNAGTQHFLTEEDVVNFHNQSFYSADRGVRWYQKDTELLVRGGVSYCLRTRSARHSLSLGLDLAMIVGLSTRWVGQLGIIHWEYDSLYNYTGHTVEIRDLDYTNSNVSSTTLADLVPNLFYSYRIDQNWNLGIRASAFFPFVNSGTDIRCQFSAGVTRKI